MLLDNIGLFLTIIEKGSLTAAGREMGLSPTTVSERLAAVSGGEINLKFQEPGAIVPALEAFDAVASGAVQAAWSTPGYWTGKDTALALFAIEVAVSEQLDAALKVRGGMARRERPAEHARDEQQERQQRRCEDAIR